MTDKFTVNSITIRFKAPRTLSDEQGAEIHGKTDEIIGNIIAEAVRLIGEYDLDEFNVTVDWAK